MKQNRTFLVIGIAVAAWLFMKNKAAAVVEPPPLPPAPPPINPTGALTIQEKLSALNYYSSQKKHNWGPKLPLMTSVEIETLYSYVFECLLAPKCLPSNNMLNRINLIQYKYQIKIPT